MSDKKSNVLLIVNPCAGRTKSRAGTFDIVDKFSSNDYKFSIHTTTCQGDATNIVRKHYEGKDLVVCCGGDGTLNETINGVMEMPNRVPIGYIPTGTTNDLANTLGIPSDIKKATDLIMSGHTNSYDIGLFNNRYFSYVASFGAFTSASYLTSQKMKNMFGHSAYLVKGFFDWASIKSVHAKIEYDGGVIEGDFMLGAVANSTSVAGIFKFPKEEVKLNDGYFEVLLIKKINPLAAPIFLKKIIKQEYDGEQIMFFKTRNFKITSEQPIAWTLDGEFGGEHKVSMIHVLSKAVNICSPENSLFLKEEPKIEVSESEDDEKNEKGRRLKRSKKGDKGDKNEKDAAEQKAEAQTSETAEQEVISENTETENAEKSKRIKRPKKSDKAVKDEAEEDREINSKESKVTAE